MKTILVAVLLVAVLAGGAKARSSEPYWHVDTFNAENLNANGPGNLAMWCGVEAGDPRASGYFHVPGYGNEWNEILLYEGTPADPSQPDTVSLEFFFNFDYEPGYGDMFVVEYDSAGTWLKTMQADLGDLTHPHGTNRDEFDVFAAPGELYSDHAQRQIVYAGNDYGSSGDVIAVRLRFLSLGAWSDEDGLWPTQAGAVQVDDVSISHAGADEFEDFEGPGPWLLEPMRGPSVTAAPRVREARLEVVPNPFNPRTQIRFNAEPGSSGTVEVYDLRGGLVRSLHSGEFLGEEFTWDGLNHRGEPVGSGVYLIRAESDGLVRTAKAALVR